ncbi:hypothetical protein SNE40_009231 [Patella caerulea]|uniref:Uncharacterized protein n=1 Tax=Patella caerulea TaxID=87958 RepID=A0AAN8Q2W0_PATCE
MADDLLTDSVRLRAGWIVYNPNHYNGNIHTWLEEYKPSQINQNCGICWLSLRSPGTQECDESGVDESENGESENSNLDGLIESFDRLQASCRPINSQTLTELAQMFNVRVGKWMFFTDTGAKVDYLWEKVATNIASGALHPAISAKVSTADDTGSHVVLIYNNDFADKDEVYITENAIRNIGIKTKMCYKADAYTYMGIYTNNPWGVRPVLYTSMFDIQQGVSNILECSDLMNHENMDTT